MFRIEARIEARGPRMSLERSLWQGRAEAGPGNQTSTAPTASFLTHLKKVAAAIGRYIEVPGSFWDSCPANAYAHFLWLNESSWQTTQFLTYEVSGWINSFVNLPFPQYPHWIRVCGSISCWTKVDMTMIFDRYRWSFNFSSFKELWFSITKLLLWDCNSSTVLTLLNWNGLGTSSKELASETSSNPIRTIPNQKEQSGTIPCKPRTINPIKIIQIEQVNYQYLIEMV